MPQLPLHPRQEPHIQHKLITQQALTQGALRNRGWQFDISPEGGMFLWAHHPGLADLGELIERLARQKILLMPGSAFAVTRGYQRFARINCSHFTPALEVHFAV